MKKGTISKKLGVQGPSPLTKKECLRKVKILKENLKKNKYKGTLREYALYYASWYKWRASNDRAAS